MNRFEKLLMNNPVRPWFQRQLETRSLLKLGGKTTGHTSLEIGCGRGIGAQIRRILDHRHQDRFDQRDFNAALEENGFKIAATGRFMGVFIWTVAVK